MSIIAVQEAVDRAVEAELKRAYKEGYNRARALHGQKCEWTVADLHDLEKSADAYISERREAVSDGHAA